MLLYVGGKAGFNSMKVRLKPEQCVTEKLNNWFQFHEGPIKTRDNRSLAKVQTSFNSMKVRLKLG